MARRNSRVWTRSRRKTYVNAILFRRALTILVVRQVIITTYHTLNLDFNIPNDVESDDELEWLKDNG